MWKKTVEKSQGEKLLEKVEVGGNWGKKSGENPGGKVGEKVKKKDYAFRTFTHDQLCVNLPYRSYL